MKQLIIRLQREFFLKIYYHSAANLNDSDQNIEFIFGEKNNYHQIGNAYIEYEMTIEKAVINVADRVPVDGDVIRIVKIAFAYCLKKLDYLHRVAQILSIIKM